jgi:hypothetical protein
LQQASACAWRFSVAAVDSTAPIASDFHRDAAPDPGDAPGRKKKRKPKLSKRIAGDAKGALLTGVSQIIKHVEAATPPPSKGGPLTRGHAPRGPPPDNPLPAYVRFADLRTAGICSTYPALKLLIERHGFPRGVWFGASTHAWELSEVLAWLAARPTERPEV